MNEDNCVLIIRSVQIQPIRNIIVSIKDILIDATLKFTQEGIRITNFDKSQTILVDVSLHADKFEFYYCQPEKIIICANTLHLFKVMSSISNEDILTIYIEKRDYNEGVCSHLGFQFDNGDIKQSSNQKLRLIEPDFEELVLPDVKYSSVINMPTVDFQKIIRDLCGISDRIEIKSVGSDLIFHALGSFAECKIFRSESDGVLEFTQRPDDNSVVVQGEFSLKSLSHFIKCTPLCSHLELYIANNLPLIVQYAASSLGEIRLCLSSLPPSM